jgi:hypothetical protein
VPVKPLARRTGSLRVVLTMMVALYAVAVGVDLAVHARYSQVPAGAVFSEILLPVDFVSLFVGLAQLVLIVIVTVLFLMWVYTANKNLRALSGLSMRFTPGWSVGWFFVPFANLFKPYQVLKEIWLVSRGAEQGGVALLGWWWGLWLLSGAVGQVAFRLSMSVDDVASHMTSMQVYAVSDALDGVLFIVTLVLVGRVAAAYASTIDETPRTAEGAGVPPAPQTTPPAPSWPAAWYPDPMSRHELRWWDGGTWTSYVYDAGVESDDPV